MPIEHNYDGDGMPFSYVVNPTCLMIFLKGEKSAIERAFEIANEARKAADNLTERRFEKFDAYVGTPYAVIDVTVNNYIPQFYLEIEKIEGIKELFYIAYDQNNQRMLSNNRSGSVVNHRYLYELPYNYEVELDDEDFMFPEETELSLPDPMEP